MLLNAFRNHRIERGVVHEINISGKQYLQSFLSVSMKTAVQAKVHNNHGLFYCLFVLFAVSNSALFHLQLHLHGAAERNMTTTTGKSHTTRITGRDFSTRWDDIADWTPEHTDTAPLYAISFAQRVNRFFNSLLPAVLHGTSVIKGDSENERTYNTIQYITFYNPVKINMSHFTLICNVCSLTSWE